MCFLLILLTKHSSLKTCACTILYLDKYHILTTCMRSWCADLLQFLSYMWRVLSPSQVDLQVSLSVAGFGDWFKSEFNPASLSRCDIFLFFYRTTLWNCVYCIRGQTFCQHTAQLAIVLPLRCPCELRGQISSKGLFANIVLIKKRVTLDYWLHVMIQVSDFHRLVW